MNEQLAQAANYIQHNLQQGVPEATLRQVLREQGWDEALIEQAFAAAQAPVLPAMHQQQAPVPGAPAGLNHHVRSGVLWILSPFIVLVGAVIVNFAIRVAGVDSSPILNILTLLAGMVGMVLLFVGPVIGIVKLSRPK
ncbi:MAG TPA: hypothetical protein VK694_01040 [Verrucomicrobiae bacterium]|nr:hypothetical protein [Verrucomicrobiae bacterium]